MDGQGDHTGLPADSPFSGDADTSHPPATYPPALSWRCLQGPNWHQHPHHGEPSLTVAEGTRRRGDGRQGKGNIACWQFKGVGFSFFIPRGWENPSHTQPQNLVERETGFSKATVLCAILFPFHWASLALLNWRGKGWSFAGPWLPWGATLG